MKRHLIRLVISLTLYCTVAQFAEHLFVYPAGIFSFTSFLPPLFGLAMGPAGMWGVALGAGLNSLVATPVFDWAAVTIVFLSAYLPCKLWHIRPRTADDPAFAFNRTTLRRFIAVVLFTEFVSALLHGLTLTEDARLSLFAGTAFPMIWLWQYVGMLWLHDFTLTIFFGAPVFFLLIGYHYDFYAPATVPLVVSRNTYAINRCSMVLLGSFFWLLFWALDASGIIYGLDKIDTWLRFLSEILITMDLTLLTLLYLMTKYRHSVMTNLMLLELGTIVMASFLLGAVSFMALSRVIDDRVVGELDKMSVIYRERLNRTFDNTVIAVTQMSTLAEKKAIDPDRLMRDGTYRQAYLDELAESFPMLATGVPGSLRCQLVLAPEFDGDGFLFTRLPVSWDHRLPDFTRSTAYRPASFTDEDEQYLAAFSSPHPDEVTERQVISYVMPIQQDDRFLGRVALTIDLAYLSHEVARMSVYERGSVYLLGEADQVLYAHHSPGETGSEAERLYETKIYLSTGLWLKITAYAHDIYADRNTMLIHFMVMMLFIFIAVSAFSVWLAKKGIRPLLLLTEAAKKIAAGELDVRLPWTSDNELGILASSIQDMVTKLESYVYRDKLTGLRNTSAYMKKAGELAEQAKNAPPDNPVRYGLVIFDANFLKRTNDTYGHDAGNELIRRAAKSICDCFAHSPVFRIGGDEFIAILETTDYERRDELMRDFDVRLSKESFMVGEHTVHVSVAHGLGIYRPGLEFAQVFQMADEAMYKHKAAIKAELGIEGR